MSHARKLLGEMMREEKREKRVQMGVSTEIVPAKNSPNSHFTSEKDILIMQLKNEYEELRTTNTAKLRDMECALEKRLSEDIGKLSIAEGFERENIAREELERFNAMMMERKATYARDFEAYQKKVLRDMEWKYCRRSFVPDCNCKKCYLRKMGVKRPRKKKTDHPINGEKKSSDEKITKNSVDEKTTTKSESMKKESDHPIKSEKKVDQKNVPVKIPSRDPKVSSSHHPVARKH